MFHFCVEKYHRARHKLSHNWRINRREFIFNLLANATWIVILLLTTFSDYIANSSNRPYIIGALVLMAVFRALAVFRPSESIEETAYREKRKINTSLVMDSIHEAILSPETVTKEAITKIRKDILDCIADHVRQYRKDLSGVKIYSNLLVEDGDDKVRVLVRNAPRKNNKVYSKKDLLSATVFKTGESVFCGNAKRRTVRNISYKSFAAFPVTDLDGKVVAVVTVDSVEMHHFDSVYLSLETSLRPYLRTLAITFSIATYA